MKTYWAGFCYGEIQTIKTCTDEGNDFQLPELFIKKAHAKKYFQDVRKVKIVEVK